MIQQLTDAEIDEIEHTWRQDLTQTAVQLDALVKRAEAEIAAGGDLGIPQEIRDMLSEELADDIESLSRLLGR